MGIDASKIKKTGRENPLVDRFTLNDAGWPANAMQWKSYLGFTQKRCDDNLATMRINKTGAEMQIEVHDGRAKVFIELHGRNGWLTYLFTKHNGTLRPDPSFVFIGQDVETGKRIIEYRDSNNNRERAGWTPKLAKSGERQWYDKEELKEFQRRWKDQKFPDDSLGYCWKFGHSKQTDPMQLNSDTDSVEADTPTEASWLSKLCCWK